MPTMSTTQTIGVRRMRLKSMYVRGLQPRPSCSLSRDAAPYDVLVTVPEHGTPAASTGGISQQSGNARAAGPCSGAGARAGRRCGQE